MSEGGGSVHGCSQRSPNKDPRKPFVLSLVSEEPRYLQLIQWWEPQAMAGRELFPLPAF